MKRKNRYLALLAAAGISAAAAFPVMASFEDLSEETAEPQFFSEQSEVSEEELPFGEVEETKLPLTEEQPEEAAKEETDGTEADETAEDAQEPSEEAGWRQDEKGFRYLREDHTYAADCWMTIEGKTYCFDKNGYRRENGWYTEKQKTYYFKENGTPAKGKLDVGGASYFMDLKTGAQCKGWAKGTSYRYYAGKDGKLVSGWQKISGKWYYFYPKSKAMAVGKKDLDKKSYFFDLNSGQMKTGWAKGTSYRYYASESGELKSGWQKISEKWYYFYPKSKAMATGLRKIDGTYYYLSAANGAMKTGWQEIGGSWYYFRADGSMHKGWLQLGSTNYYLRSNGKMYQNETFTYNGLTGIADKNGAVTMQSKAAEYARRKLNQIGWNLRAAFSWSAGLTYYRPTPTPPAGIRHSEHYANFGFEHLMGNCYVMADTFYFMAKLLGYEVYNVEGLVPLARGGMGPHGWTEIVLNGATYVFDPNFTNETGRNGYQIYYGMSGTWRYSSYHRAD